MIVGDQDAYNLRCRRGRGFHDGMGTVRTMLVPCPAAVRISNFPSICEALVRRLRNPKPSLFSRLALETPAPQKARFRRTGQQEPHGETGFGLVYPSLRILRKFNRSSSCWALSWRLPTWPFDSVAEVAWEGGTPVTFWTLSRTSGGGKSGV